MKELGWIGLIFAVAMLVVVCDIAYLLRQTLKRLDALVEHTGLQGPLIMNQMQIQKGTATSAQMINEQMKRLCRARGLVKEEPDDKTEAKRDEPGRDVAVHSPERSSSQERSDEAVGVSFGDEARRFMGYPCG